MGKENKELGVAATPPGCQPSASAADASSQSGIPNAGLLEIADLPGFLAALKEHLDPVFDEQAAVWEREGPAAVAAFEATGATLDWIGGNCPVQAEGTVDAQPFYFRARGEHWEFWVGEPWTAEAFSIEREYGSWPDAGWMPKHEAYGFIVEGIAAFRASAIEAASAGETRSGSTEGESAAPKEDAR